MPLTTEPKATEMDSTFFVCWVLLGIPGGLVLAAKSPPSQRSTAGVVLGIIAIFMLGPILTLLAFIYRKEPPSN
jgi:hypothetical protein